MFTWKLWCVQVLMCVWVCVCVCSLDTCTYMSVCVVPHLKLHGWDQPRCSCGYVTYVIMFVVCSWLPWLAVISYSWWGTIASKQSLLCFYFVVHWWVFLWGHSKLVDLLDSNSEKIFSKFVLVFLHLKGKKKKEVQETFYSSENNLKTNYSKLEMGLK